MEGGCVSHFGIDPKYFTADGYEEKDIQFRDRVLTPLFFNPNNDKLAPFYLYVNVTIADTLRKVLANPKKYAPNGVYIVRIPRNICQFPESVPGNFILPEVLSRDNKSCRHCLIIHLDIIEDTWRVIYEYSQSLF